MSNPIQRRNFLLIFTPVLDLPVWGLRRRARTPGGSRRYFWLQHRWQTKHGALELWLEDSPANRRTILPLPRREIEKLEKELELKDVEIVFLGFGV